HPIVYNFCGIDWPTASMEISLSALSHAAALLGYGAFAIFLVVAGARTWLKALLFFAAAFTAGWGGSVFSVGTWGFAPQIAVVASAIRDGAWYAVVLGILYHQPKTYSLWRALALATVCVVGVHILFVLGDIDIGRIVGVEFDSEITGLAEVIFGLILTENM